MKSPDSDNTRPGNPRHTLSEEDIRSFFGEASRPQRSPKPSPIDAQGLLDHLALRHPLRIARMRRDMLWLRRRGRKFNIEVF